MVEIRRPAPRKQGSKLCNLRNVILALVGFQCLRIFMNFLQTIDAPTPLKDAGQPLPKSVEDTLKDSKEIRTKSPLRKVPKPNAAVSPKAADRHDNFEDSHHLNRNPDKTDGDRDHDIPSKRKDSTDDHQVPELPEEPAEDSKHGQKMKNTPEEPIPGSPNNKLVAEKKGTGPMKVGYVKDFQDERMNPRFRKIIVEAVDASQTVASLVKETSVKPCDTSQGKQIGMDPTCLDSDTPLIAYNSAPFPRIWCGKEIKNDEAVVMGEHCSDPVVHLFSAEAPPVSGEGMPPIVIKAHDDVDIHDSDLETVECDIPCKQEKGIDGSMRFIHGEPWSITQTWQDSYSNQMAKIERTDYRVDKYYSTQSFKSSVPLTYFDFEKYSLKNRPSLDYDAAKNRAVYLVDTACASQSSKRQKYFHATSAVYPVDSYGTCHHNTDIPAGMTIKTAEGRIEIMKQYRFVLAFDATSEKDHISPLVWEALISGAVPVFVGADNIRDHLPPNSFIYAGDYKDWDEMAKYVKTVAESKSLWESYHAWRTDENALTALEAKYNFSRTDPTCRMCRWAYAKKYGLGWDEAKQEVVELKSPRQLCISKGLASKPFQEEWLARLNNDETTLKLDSDASETCTSMTSEEDVEHDSFTVHRTIVQHDGVADMIIKDIETEHTEGEFILRLNFPGVRNSDGACFHNTHTLVQATRNPIVSSASIQDEFSKVTILADWVTEVTSPSEGVMEVVIQGTKDGEIKKDFPKRIRVISEGVSKIHDKMTEFFPSSFSKRMIKDFTDPLEVFFADS